MPYVDTATRIRLSVGQRPRTPGELNYVVTRMIDAYLIAQPFSYSRINDVIGVLECAKLEVYRRIASPYEDAKRRENGDAFSIVPESGEPQP